MALSDKQLIGTLNHLYKICRAGERGFEVAAANVSNRGLKIFLKTYAQQRAQFAAELCTEVERLGGQCTDKRHIRGIIHRGRIAIVATLIIETDATEKMVLNEAIHGEKVAVKAYQKALNAELPFETQAITERQYGQLLTVGEQIARLRGRPGDRLVIRLFDSDQDLKTAVQTLQYAGFAQNRIDTVALGQATDVYEGNGSLVFDTAISGLVGGAIWGSILGAAAGVGMMFVPGLKPFGASTIEAEWALIALGGTIIGALFGTLLGFLIGVGFSGEDRYLYSDSLQHGNKLIMLQTNRRRAPEAAQIMHQVNAASRAEPRVKSA